MQLNFFVSIVFVGQMLNGFDDNLLGGFQALLPWRQALGNPSQSDIGLLSASAYISGLFTAPVAAYVADRWGRCWCIRYSACTMLVGSILGSCAGLGNSGFALFVVSRIVIGSGLAFCLMVSPIILQEIPHPRHRVLVAGLFNLNYAVGSFIVAWMIFGTGNLLNDWSWRIPYVSQIIPALYLVIAVHFMPESPRWLFSQGREEEAMAFLVKYHGNGDPNDELVLFEAQEMREAIALEKVRKQDTWAQLFATKGNRHRIAIVMLIVICQNLSGTAITQGYYTQILNLVGITGTQQQTGINAGLTGFVIVSALLGASIVNRVPRRKLLMVTWSCLILVNVGLVVSSAQYVNTGSTAAAYTNIVMVWLYTGTFFVVCGPLFFSYPAECLSYSIRAKGMMIWGITNKTINVFNSYVNAIALERIGWKYYLVYTVLLVLQLIGMWFLCPETQGYTLEEIAILFDGPGAVHVDPTSFEHGSHEKKDDVGSRVVKAAREEIA